MLGRLNTHKEPGQSRYPIRVSCEVFLCQGTVRFICLADMKWKTATLPHVPLWWPTEVSRAVPTRRECGKWWSVCFQWPRFSFCLCPQFSLGLNYFAWKTNKQTDKPKEYQKCFTGILDFIPNEVSLNVPSIKENAKDNTCKVIQTF